MHTRSYCEECGTYRFKPAGELCGHCRRAADTPASPPPVTFGGCRIAAPGFTPDQFERAIARALVDDLQVHTDATGLAIVGPRGVNGGYRVTRTSCDCKAGSTGTPCKHRALFLFHLHVRVPARKRQWEAAHRAAATRQGAA